MPKLRNRDKLPVIVVGGCHNTQFNVTMSNFIKDLLHYKLRYFHLPEEDDPFLGPYWKNEWVPRDWSSWQVLRKNGGSIGTIGNSGYGWGYINQYCLEGLGGWIGSRFFDAYVNQSKGTLGEAHDQAISDYINIVGGAIQAMEKTEKPLTNGYFLEIQA